MLGREPRDHVELAEVLLLRNDELMRVIVGELWLGQLSPAAPDGVGEGEATTQPALMLDIVEDALLEQGWRLDHPAVRGVLIGPRGERFDARPLVAMTDSRAAFEAVRATMSHRT